MNNYIYRDFEMSLSREHCANLLQTAAKSNAKIVSTAFITNAFPEEKIGRWTYLVKLEFSKYDDITKFDTEAKKLFGYTSTVPPLITGQ